MYMCCLCAPTAKGYFLKYLNSYRKHESRRLTGKLRIQSGTNARVAMNVMIVVQSSALLRVLRVLLNIGKFPPKRYYQRKSPLLCGRKLFF